MKEIPLMPGYYEKINVIPSKRKESKNAENEMEQQQKIAKELGEKEIDLNLVFPSDKEDSDNKKPEIGVMEDMAAQQRAFEEPRSEGINPTLVLPKVEKAKK